MTPFGPPVRRLPAPVLGIVLLCLVFGPPVAAQPTTPADTTARARLAATIADTIGAEAFAGALWGVQVVNLRSGEVLYARNATQSFVPASNVKLVTSAAALAQLGPDYRYTTRLYATGPVRDGTLRGSLVARGTGDPTLGGYQQRTDPTQVFRRWADSLRQRGITQVDGAVVGDPGAIDGTAFGEGWSWKDLTYGYGAPVNGLVFNENKVDLELRGRSVGAPATITWTPFNTDYVTVVNQSRTVPRSAEDDEEYHRPLGSNTIRVRTKIHPQATEDEGIAIANPTRYFAHTLRRVLVREGLAVTGGSGRLARIGPLPSYDSLRSVATYTSPPLSRIVRTLNHESRNIYAEQLLRTLAVEVPPETEDDLAPGSAALGVKAVRKTLVRAGVDTSRVELVDGSGLSRQNLISPRALVRVLQHMWIHDDSAVSQAFHDSLPRGGREGTLAYRFRDPSSAGGDVRAKTGTLSGVSALSGYVRSGTGAPLAFSILCNHHQAEADRVRAAQDALVNAMARLPL